MQTKSPDSTVEMFQSARLIPAWLWALMLGVVTIAVLSVVADYKLPEKSRLRAIWSTFQILGGLLVCWITCMLVTFRIKSIRDSLKLSDIFFPDRLLAQAIKNLPSTRWHVCVASWAIVAAVCAVVWPGGLTYWLPAKSQAVAGKKSNGKGKKSFIDSLIAAAKKVDEFPEEEQKLMEEVVAPEIPEKPIEEVPAEEKSEQPKIDGTEKEQPIKRTVEKCTIIGYSMEGGLVTGLHVSRTEEDHVRYAGFVPVTKDPEISKAFLERFAGLKADTPLFPDLTVQATWLKPSLQCEVEAAGVDENKLFKESVFKGLLLPKNLASATRGGLTARKAKEPLKSDKDANKEGKEPVKNAQDAGKFDPSRPK